MRTDARPRIVAIDGASGSGKSTLARGLARALDLPYVNTGLMYRALATAALDHGVRTDDEPSLVELTRGLSFTVAGNDPPELQVEGYDVHRLMTLEVEAVVSSVASHPAVRSLMRATQRAIGERHGAVMEGRDIGSVVFSDAPVKLYLSAGVDQRAGRRAGERDAGLDQIERSLTDRDARDARTTPHVPADGAVIIDTTDLGIDRTLEAALGAVARLAPELVP
jgi:cytidylate kinase